MNRDDLLAVGLRTTLVAFVLLLVFSSGAYALVSMDYSDEGVQIDQQYECPSIEYEMIAIRFASITVDTVDLSEHSYAIETAASDILETLSDSGDGLVLPVGIALFRYSRYDDSDPLDNDVRRQVYESIEQSPGTYISEVSEECDASRSTVRYHIRILEEEGLIVGEAVRGKHRFHPMGSDDPALAAALNDDATARVLDAIARLEPVTVSSLADDLDRSPGTVSYHLDRLTDDDLLLRERVGNAVVTRLANDVQTEMIDRDNTIVTPAD